jgi:hypothetical protein
VPWRLIGGRVQVTLGAGMVRVSHAGREVAAHAVLVGRRESRIFDIPLETQHSCLLIQGSQGSSTF